MQSTNLTCEATRSEALQETVSDILFVGDKIR